MLISGAEAKSKFRILEAQLIQILESGQVTAYTKKGYPLAAEQLQKHRDEAYSNQICYFKKQFDKISEEEIFKSTLHEMAKRTSLENLALHFYYDENELETTLTRLYPTSFMKEVGLPPQEKMPKVQSDNNITDKEKRIREHVEEWEAALPFLNGTALTAARLAIEKWKGKSHIEAFEATRPGDVVQDPKNFVSKKRKEAEQIALQHGLTMPPWESK